MKLRIKGNSIRLRLGESEVAQLIKEGAVSDSTHFSAFPASRLSYTLATSRGCNEITATFVENEIKVTVPESTAQTWANSDIVGLNHRQQINTQLNLSILIEKDFHCLVPRPGEDESDSFLNPAGGKNHKP